MEANSGSSVRVFDGTTDFRVWRARVENELMRYHLLGYVMVRGYDGSQSFTYNGEVVPPRASVVLEEDEQQQQAILKEEVSGDRSTTTQRGRLSRWDVLGESAEAKGILQRYLHPDVESAILNKNIYDSWLMLCTLYGNRSSPGAQDVYEMHRVLHHIRLGDKNGESVREFITRCAMLMQQYAIVTGIELTDAFRSVTLTQTLPSAWRPMVASWRGARPFVPYVELVEKVVATRERMHAESSGHPSLIPVKASTTLTTSSTDTPRSKERAAADKLAVRKPVDQTMIKSIAHDKSAEKPTSNAGEKQLDESADQCEVESPKSSNKRARSSGRAPSSMDLTKETGNTLDLRTGEISSSKRKSPSSPRSRDNCKKSSSDRLYRDSKINDVNYERRHTYDKHGSERRFDKYASSSRYDRSRSQYSKKYESFERNEHAGPVSCFYCLKVGHQLKHCWYLKADIESGTTHEPHKKYTCAVTIDRSEFMVCCLEAYIDEVNRERVARRASKSTTSASRRSGYDVSEGAGRNYRSQQQELTLPPPPGQPPNFAARDQQPSSGTSTTDYRKRSHSVFQSAEGRILSRDPRLNRLNSVHRSTDVTEEFSPRKRGRIPSFERHLQAYY